ncbi:hypothetical protein [Aeoliella sp. SH292]|uniref:hypothetical protein n=1 Tax=Aeoliella sp. SH292 TaxID=3454464 RepID=UPI003F9C3A9E
MLVRLGEVIQSSELQLPELLARMLRAQVGDTISVFETKDGVELRRCDDEFSGQMRHVHEIMKEDREVLRRLAE